MAGCEPIPWPFLRDRGSGDLSVVNEVGEPIVPEREFTLSIGGGQPQTSAPAVTQTFRVKGTITLSE